MYEYMNVPVTPVYTRNFEILTSLYSFIGVKMRANICTNSQK